MTGPATDSPTGIAEAIEILRRLPTATVYEAAGKAGDMAPAIRPMLRGVGLCGPAFTVRIFPGETLAVLRAVATAPAGSVLVIDAGGTERGTVWGGSSTIAAERRGLAGCVTNGAVRDLAELEVARFPVFAAGVSVRGTLKTHPGWSALPVAVGDVVVAPGDVVLGDDDGVLVIPAARAFDVAQRALAQRAAEEAREERLRAGESLLTVLGLEAG